MTSRKKFAQFLLDHKIKYDLPNDILDDETIFDSIHAVCEKLIASKPSLLNSRNLKTLMRVARDAFFFTGIHNGQLYSQRPAFFKNAINQLFLANPSVLNQDTFDGLCRITTANTDQMDMDTVAQCFIKMEKLHLLTKKNTQALVENVIHSPLRRMRARGLQMISANGSTQFTNGPDLPEPSRTEVLNNLLTACPWLKQEDFNLVMRRKTNKEINKLSQYMQELHKKGLETPANQYRQQLKTSQTRTIFAIILAIIMTPISLIFTLSWLLYKKHNEPIKKLTLAPNEMQAIKDKRQHWRNTFINDNPSIAKKPKDLQDKKMLLEHDVAHKKDVFLVSKETYERYKFFLTHNSKYLDQATPEKVKKLGIKI